MSKSSELDRQVKLYILEVLSDHAETNNANDCIKYMKDRFNNEMNWLIDRDGSQKAMKQRIARLKRELKINLTKAQLKAVL